MSSANKSCVYDAQDCIVGPHCVSARRNGNMSQNENLASSGGSGGAMVGTQELSACSFSDDETPDGVWGRLFPCNSKFISLVLTKDKYTFGRDSECDYCFNSPQLKSHSSFTSLSKFHFSLIREKTSTGIFTLLEDHSSNGTYINGVKVGKHP
ncbi:serine/threonine-protein kinase Chk2-like, partial [Centruroides sculpturatus]|uniref:serine/threonine-protein kinase Chk2-like n=1 Tax=Centruroides sculpturatus TaxID=218467 RepID=UPI000C6DA8D1